MRVKECHPSTSSAKGSNDLMLEDTIGVVVVRCEVCDVASDSAGSNGKERKDVASLGCADGVPDDGVRRFLCTSPEFARAAAQRGLARAQEFGSAAFADGMRHAYLMAIENGRRSRKA